MITVWVPGPLTLHTTYSRNNMGQKCEVNNGLWVLNEIIKRYILKIKNPQTTIALTFLTHIISGIGGVFGQQFLVTNFPDLNLKKTKIKKICSPYIFCPSDLLPFF